MSMGRVVNWMRDDSRTQFWWADSDRTMHNRLGSDRDVHLSAGRLYVTDGHMDLPCIVEDLGERSFENARWYVLWQVLITQGFADALDFWNHHDGGR